METDKIFKKAESTANKLGITKGTWYIVNAVPDSSDNSPAGYFLMIPNDHGDSIIMINIEDGKSYFMHMSKYSKIEMIGVVRQGKADKNIWI